MHEEDESIMESEGPMEIDDELGMAGSRGSSSMPSTSVSDMKDGVGNLGICINLSSLSRVPGLYNRPAITTDCIQTYLPSTLSSIISNTCICSVSTTGMSNSSSTMVLAAADNTTATTSTTTTPATITTTAAATTTVPLIYNFTFTRVYT